MTSWTQFSEPIPPSVNEGTYKVGKKIGSGSFGEIYAGVDTDSHEKVAIKFELVSCKHPQLSWEAKLYRILSGGVGIPQVKWFGTESSFNILVLDLLGPSLEDLFNYCNRSFSLKTVLMIGDQMLRRIEYLHAKHHLHRDIKPDNFLIGIKEKSNQIFLIDFGLSKKFRDPKTHRHIKYRDDKSLTGTARYVSCNTHLGIEQSRRDDLEGIGYILVYLYRGTLPWQGLKANDKKQKYDLIAEKKLSTSIDILCTNCPKEFHSYMGHVRTLGFEQKPNYSYLRSLFRQLLVKENLHFDGNYDWNEKFKTENLSPETSFGLDIAVRRRKLEKEQKQTPNTSQVVNLTSSRSSKPTPTNSFQKGVTQRTSKLNSAVTKNSTLNNNLKTSSTPTSSFIKVSTRKQRDENFSGLQRSYITGTHSSNTGTSKRKEVSVRSQKSGLGA